jgi:hypothetical protein
MYVKRVPLDQNTDVICTPFRYTGPSLVRATAKSWLMGLASMARAYKLNAHSGMVDITRMSSISPAASSGLAQAQLAQQVGIKIAAKTLDAARAQGDAAISLLQAAASIQEQSLGSIESHLGQSLDVRA